MIRKALEGKDVVRLKGGDPFVFGRGGEEAQELRNAGIEYEIVPGVSSCYGAPAYAGIPITHRAHASSFHVVTGQEGEHKAGQALDYGTLAKEEGTLVFLMGLKNLPEIASNLIRNGKDPKTPAAVVQQGSTARQKTAAGTLETIADEAKNAGIQSPAISIVGDVVSLRDEIQWYGQKPLSGRRVLVTATGELARQICHALEAEGAEAIPFSLIDTKSLFEEASIRAMESLGTYTWIVFTSANGVQRFFELLREGGKDIRCLSALRFAVIGKGTKDALEAHGIRADFMPSRYSSGDMAREWVPTLASGDRVLMLRAKEASKELNCALEEAQIPYADVPVYCTEVDWRKAEELNRMLSQVDYVTFASASAVNAFASMLDGKPEELLASVVCIGPVTAKAAKEAGLAVRQSAVEYTAEGICSAVLYDVIRARKLSGFAGRGSCGE